ncbi:MAG: zinc-finger domain-containing protein [Alphaproteobacteria bacterium]
MIPAIIPISETPMSVEAPESVEVSTSRVACDGGGGALGHPRVYLEMGDEHFVECPYCDKRFVLKAGAIHH